MLRDLLIAFLGYELLVLNAKPRRRFINTIICLLWLLIAFHHACIGEWY